MSDAVPPPDSLQTYSPQDDLDWPIPPYFELDEPAQALGPEDCSIRRADGAEIKGALIRYAPERGLVIFHKDGAPAAEAIRLAEIRLLRLLRPLRLNKRDAGISALGDAVIPASETQDFTIEFAGGEVLKGETAGYVSDKVGVFLFRPVAGGRVERLLAPKPAVGRFTLGEPIGEMLLAESKAGRGGLEAAVERQALMRSQRIGDLLNEGGAASREEIAEALERQKKLPALRLGDFLLEQKVISQAELEAALVRQRENRSTPLGQILVESGVVDATTLNKALARKLGVPFVQLAKYSLDPATVRLVSAERARLYRIIPLYTTDRELVLAMEDPLQLHQLADLRFSLGLSLVPVLASTADIDAALDRCYGLSGVARGMESPPGADGADSREPAHPAGTDPRIDSLAQQLIDENDGREVAEEESLGESESTLVRLVNKMIEDARQFGASDIHVEANPGKQNTRIRFRKDGVMREYLQLPPEFRRALVSRIKIMARLDIAERRRPQDGKIDFGSFARRPLELRVATIPTANGLEDVVLRLLAGAKAVPLDALVASPGILADLKRCVVKPFGLILVCGPTGSGKTTTLHSLVGHINTDERKIWTAEDPIEISQPGLRQIQVHPKIGWTFAAALRALLRADPDVIMVGEMRDEETASTAVEASLTGHLVLSTLHTNSAAESVVRLLDLGVDPFTVADSLIAVLAQRLVRKLCMECREAEVLDGDAVNNLALEYCADTPARPEDSVQRWNARFREAPVLYRARGCEACDRTGYRGRIGLYELLLVTPQIKRLVQTRAVAGEIRDAAFQVGMMTLRQHGIERALEGETDMHQVRATCS